MINVTQKTVKPSHLKKKIQIIQNIDNLMFEVIFIFSNIIQRKVLAWQGGDDMSKNAQIQCILQECAHYKFENFS